MDESNLDNIQNQIRCIRDFLKVMDQAQKENVDLINRINELEKAETDWLHEVEFLPPSDCSLEKIKGIRQLRRKIKDKRELQYPIKEFAKDHKNMRNNLKNVLLRIEQILQKQNARGYTPKNQNESKAAWRHFDVA